MNQGLVSIAVLSLFLTGCDLGKESNNIKSIQTGHNKMADNKQDNLQDNLQALDKQISILETQLERAKNGLLPLEELKEALCLIEDAKRTFLSCIADPKYTAGAVEDRGKRMVKAGKGLMEVWYKGIDGFVEYLVTDTANKEAHIQDSEKTLDSISIQDAWEKTSSLRQMLEEQKTLIKQVRDEEVEKTFAKVENFIKDSEERLKNAIEARKHNDYELSHLHVERFYDKFHEIKDTMDTAYTRIWTLRGNTSLLITSSDKTVNKANKLIDDVQNVGSSIEPNELEYLKTSTLNEEEIAKLVIELLDKAIGYLQEAKKEGIIGNYGTFNYLYEKSDRFFVRAEYLTRSIGDRFPNTPVLPGLEVKYKNHDKLLQEYIEMKATSPSTPLDVSTWDKLKEIDSSLKKAQEVADQVDKEIGLYLKYRDREVSTNTPDTQSPIDAMKQESEMVKVSLDGSVVPYKQGDPIAEGEGVGYTYTSLAQLPSTDTGEAFNGLGGRKRRVVSSSVRVLNAQGLEVGTTFDKMYLVKELKDEAKTGEFDCPIGGSFTSQDGLCLRQKGANTGAITAVVTNFSVGG